MGRLALRVKSWGESLKVHKPSTCTPCAFFNISNGFSLPEGSGNAHVAIFGEVLGYEEYLDGLPFRPKAQAGSKLEECIRNVGELRYAPHLGKIKRENFLLWNTIACQPPNNDLYGYGVGKGSDAIRCCSQYRTRVIRNFQKRIREEQENGNVSHGDMYRGGFALNTNSDSNIDIRHPKPDTGQTRQTKLIILALGNTAFQTLTSESHSVLDVAGYPFEHYDSGDGARSPTEDILIIPSYHPAYIKRGNAHLTPLLTEDIKIALAHAHGQRLTKKEYKAKCSWHFVGHDEAEAFYYRLRDNPKLVVAHDIETATAGYVPEDERGGFPQSVGSLDPNEDITQIQFATDKYKAVIFPNFDGKYRALAKKILELPNVKANHNTWNFDNPRLKQKYGINIDESRCHDTMWMFKKWYPKLPAGLQRVASLAGFPFAWKMLFGADPEEYGGADVCAIHWILEWLPPLMKARGCWEGYYRYVYQLHPILDAAATTDIVEMYPEDENEIEKVGKVERISGGLPVNNKRRLELREELKERQLKLNVEIQKLVPGEIRNIKPKHQVKTKTGETKLNKKGKEVAIEKKLEGIIDYGYVKAPKAIEAAKIRYAHALQEAGLGVQTGGKSISEVQTAFGFDNAARSNEFSNIGFSSESDTQSEGQPTTTKKPAKFATFETFIKKALQLEQRNVESFDRKTGESKGQVIRWVKVEPFKASMDQLLRYIKWKKVALAKSSNKEDRILSKKYYVPTTHKGKETTRKDEIELLFDKTGDELLQMVLEDRSLTTNIRNYIPNWEPSIRTGCVHTQWGFTASSGQINSSAPNVLNVSKHTEIGQLFRRIIEAPEGWEFLELDKKSFHVATMGYVCNDPSYIRFSQLDPHSIFVSHIMPKEWGKPIELSMKDDEILEYCKYIKKRCKQRAIDLGKPHGDIRQYQAKPTVLGNQLGLGPHKLYWQNRRSMENLQAAITYQSVLADMFPITEAAKPKIKYEAAQATYLTNEFGCIEHYFDVFNFRWNKKRMDWDRSEGDEARNPIAFRVQGCAFGMIKEELYRILNRLGFKAPQDTTMHPGERLTDVALRAGWGEKVISGETMKSTWVRETKQDWAVSTTLHDMSTRAIAAASAILPYFPFRMSIHDSLVFLIRRSDRERVLGVALEEMNRPCAKLRNAATDSMGPGGLKIGVEWSAGRNLMNWDKDKNPEGMREGG